MYLGLRTPFYSCTTPWSGNPSSPGTRAAPRDGSSDIPKSARQQCHPPLRLPAPVRHPLTGGSVMTHPTASRATRPTAPRLGLPQSRLTGPRRLWTPVNQLWPRVGGSHPNGRRKKLPPLNQETRTDCGFRSRFVRGSRLDCPPTGGSCAVWPTLRFLATTPVPLGPAPRARNDRRPVVLGFPSAALRTSFATTSLPPTPPRELRMTGGACDGRRLARRLYAGFRSSIRTIPSAPSTLMMAPSGIWVVPI